MTKESDIGEKLRDIRRSKNLSQSKLVARLIDQGINISRETLSKIENNNRSISAIELRALSNVLNIDIRDFFYEDKEENLVTFFRKKNASENTLKEVAELQNMIKTFIDHEKIYKEELDS